MTDISQVKSQLKTDSVQIFERILKVLGVANANQAAEKLKLTKQSVYDWKKNTPSVESLVLITQTAESGNASLNWILSGEGEMSFGSKTSSSLDEIFEDKIREIVRVEIKDIKLFESDEADEIEEVKYTIFPGSENSLRNKLITIHNRIRSSFSGKDSEISRRLYERFKDDLHKLGTGEIPPASFFRDVAEATEKNVIWLVDGEGEEDLKKPTTFSPAQLTAVSQNSSNAFALHQTLEGEQRREKIKKANEKRLAKQAEFKRIIKQEVGEYMKENLKPILLEIFNKKRTTDLGSVGGTPDEYKPPTQDKEQNKKVA